MPEHATLWQTLLPTPIHEDLKLENDILKYQQDIDSSIDLINTYKGILDTIERNGWILKNLIGINVKQQ